MDIALKEGNQPGLPNGLGVQVKMSREKCSRTDGSGGACDTLRELSGTFRKT